MKKVTLRNYCTSKYKEYWENNYSGKRNLYYVLKISRNDERLAIVAQSYYYSTSNFELAHKFAAMTHENYKTMNEFEKSKNKYVRDFSQVKINKNNAKLFFKDEIVILVKKLKTNYNAIARTTQFTKSKLYSFFNDGDNQALSLNKLRMLYDFLISKTKAMNI